MIEPAPQAILVQNHELHEQHAHEKALNREAEGEANLVRAIVEQQNAGKRYERLEPRASDLLEKRRRLRAHHDEAKEAAHGKAVKARLKRVVEISLACAKAQRHHRAVRAHDDEGDGKKARERPRALLHEEDKAQ